MTQLTRIKGKKKKSTGLSIFKHCGFAGKPFPGERNASCRGATGLFHFLKPRNSADEQDAARFVTRRGRATNCGPGPVPTETGWRGPGGPPRSSLPLPRQPLHTGRSRFGEVGQAAGSLTGTSPLWSPYRKRSKAILTAIFTSSSIRMSFSPLARPPPPGPH